MSAAPRMRSIFFFFFDLGIFELYLIEWAAVLPIELNNTPRMGSILNITSNIPEKKALYVTLAWVLLESHHSDKHYSTDYYQS